MIDLIESYIRYGLSWTALAYFIIRNRKLRKYINNSLPRILRDTTDSDIAEIKRDIKDIKFHLEVEDGCGNTKKSLTTGATNFKRLYSLLPKEMSLKNRLRSVKKKMKAYLKKLGSRKFQAFLSITIPNLIILIGFMVGGIDLEGKVNEWMPAINLVIQAVATAIYQAAESSVDRAHAKGVSNEPNYNESDHLAE